MPVLSPGLARRLLSISDPLIFPSVDWSHTREHDQPEPHDRVLSREARILSMEYFHDELCQSLEDKINEIAYCETDDKTLADLMEFTHRYLECLTTLRQ